MYVFASNKTTVCLQLKETGLELLHARTTALTCHLNNPTDTHQSRLGKSVKKFNKWLKILRTYKSGS